jgi:hypothetical protein
MYFVVLLLVIFSNYVTAQWTLNLIDLNSYPLARLEKSSLRFLNVDCLRYLFNILNLAQQLGTCPFAHLRLESRDFVLQTPYSVPVPCLQATLVTAICYLHVYLSMVQLVGAVSCHLVYLLMELSNPLFEHCAHVTLVVDLLV